ncbi:DUF6233 domain-containing protein [Streptomyces lomondensis]|uniref:Uncharacterized protein n=1 Tax=Streptomyces lomondensis TaxID=68229 RepID=A0ABQ2XVN2_9ACTN|nr:DUF6233 domain-containing protein [Streptomyces lomondensis]MCF0082778.1 DUF6233 domain-containing protein [Streptomyces lomondensis]GGX36489.1 hypothetical protein GCM10010383_78250 [Streptomyces lomondensis]
MRALSFVSDGQAAVAEELARTRRWIADEERRVGEARRPTAPEWLIERGLDRSNIVAVYTGECWDPGKRVRPATRVQALEALRHQVPACSKCRPDTVLGIEV